MYKRQFSCWIKRGNISVSAETALFGSYTDANNRDVLRFKATDELEFQNVSGGTTYSKKSDAKYRDPSAWYHVVLVYDSANSTADHRIRLYINGSELTSSTGTDPGSGTDSSINNNVKHFIGARSSDGNPSLYWEGYMAEVHHIDGSALTPSAFGETDSDTGQWIPKKYNTASGAYGTNGFYMPWKKNDRYSVYFDDTSNTGISIADSSDWDFGTNNFTVECWIYRNEDAGDQSYIFGQADNTNGSNSGNSVYISVYDQHLSGIAVDASNTNNYVYLYSTADSTTIEDNKWYHVAMVRSGNDWNLYLNGTSIDSETTSITVNSCSSIFGVGKQGVYNDGFWKGWISNFRLVMGTAVYTSNFTPPTSPLTAITNTKLLCCQDADPTVDNSGTGKTLTVTAANTYTQQMAPFQFDWYQDQSGQDNDYHPDNVTVNDVMQDSPTNNFSTMNFLNTGTYTTLSRGALLSQGNTSSDAGWTHSNFAMPDGSGEWYSEHRIGQLAGSGSNYPSIGVSSTKDSYYNGTLTTSRFYNNYCRIRATGNCEEWGSVFTEQSGMDLGATLADDDIISIAVDTDNKKIWFAKNGTWIGSGNPGGNSTPSFTYTDTSDLLISIQHLSDSAASWVYSNYGQDSTFNGNLTAAGNNDANGYGDFKYAVPSGFKAMCTQNLATPTIKKSTDNFNVITYTGTGAVDHDVTGVGFQPDIFWLKSISGDYTYNHTLLDSVRGAGNPLQPNSTDEEKAWSDYMGPFSADGIRLNDVQVGTQVNSGSHGYVAWCWKLGGSASSNTDGSINTTATLANTTTGMSISTYGGAGGVKTVGHGLGKVPDVVIVKCRSTASIGWCIYLSLIHI